MGSNMCCSVSRDATDGKPREPNAEAKAKGATADAERAYLLARKKRERAHHVQLYTLKLRRSATNLVRRCLELCIMIYAHFDYILPHLFIWWGYLRLQKDDIGANAEELDEFLASVCHKALVGRWRPCSSLYLVYFWMAPWYLLMAFAVIIVGEVVNWKEWNLVVEKSIAAKISALQSYCEHTLTKDIRRTQRQLELSRAVCAFEGVLPRDLIRKLMDFDARYSRHVTDDDERECNLSAFKYAFA